MRKKIKTTTNKGDKRLFIMLYYDCLESDLLADPYEVTLYMALKRFAGSSNQCFPSLQTLADEAKMSKRKAQMTLKELEKKHIISIQNRTNAKGGKTSNLYIVHDFKELWESKDNAAAAAAIEAHEIKMMIETLQSVGYEVNMKKETAPDNATVMAEPVVEEETTVIAEPVIEKTPIVPEEPVVSENIIESVEIKEKGLVSGSVPTTDTSTTTTSINLLSSENNTIQTKESQPLERYTMEEIRKRYDYYIYMLRNPTERTDIDTVFNILYDALNTTKEALRVNREDKPAMVVISRLLKLNMEDILYVIEQYSKQTDRITHVHSYLLSMLYNAKEQYHLDIQNQVSHDMDQWYEQKARERMEQEQSGELE